MEAEETCYIFFYQQLEGSSASCDKAPLPHFSDQDASSSDENEDNGEEKARRHSDDDEWSDVIEEQISNFTATKDVTSEQQMTGVNQRPKATPSKRFTIRENLSQALSFEFKNMLEYELENSSEGEEQIEKNVQKSPSSFRSTEDQVSDNSRSEKERTS